MILGIHVAMIKGWLLLVMEVLVELAVMIGALHVVHVRMDLVHVHIVIVGVGAIVVFLLVVVMTVILLS